MSNLFSCEIRHSTRKGYDNVFNKALLCSYYNMHIYTADLKVCMLVSTYLESCWWNIFDAFTLKEL